MHKHLGLLLFLLVLTFVSGTALAEDDFERAYVPYESISLASQSGLQDVIDWIEDYQYRDMAYALNQATYLADYVFQIEQNREIFEGLVTVYPADEKTEQIQQWWADYNSAAAGAVNAPRSISTNNYRKLTQIDNKLTYYDVHLSDLQTQIMSLRMNILSGNYGDEDEAAEMKAKMELLSADAQNIAAEAVAFITGERVVNTVATAFDQMDALANPETSGSASMVQAIQGLGGYLVQAKTESLGANNPTITVISKSQFSFNFVDKTKDPFGSEYYIDDLKVTVTTDDGKREKTILTKGGKAIFDMGDFLTNGDGFVNVRVKWEDTLGRFCRQNFGRLVIEGGEVFDTHVQPIPEGKPYLAGLLFEDLDMITYGGGMLMGLDAGKKTFNVNVEIEPNGTSGKFELYYENAQRADGSVGPVVLFSEPYSASRKSFSVPSRWLDESDGNTQPHFLPGKEKTLSMQFTGVHNSASLMAQGVSDGIKTFASFTTDSTKWYDGFFTEKTTSKQLTDGFLGNFSIRVPSSVPIIGNMEIAIPKALTDGILDEKSKLLRFQVRLDAGRTLSVRYNFADFNRRNTEETKLYENNGIRAMKERREKEVGKVTSLHSLYSQGISDMNGARAERFYGSVYAEAQIFVGAFGELNFEKSKSEISEISIEFTGQVGVIWTLTGDWTLYPLPTPLVSLGVSLTGRFTASMGIGGALKLGLPGGSYRGFDFSKAMGMTISLRVELGLTLGLGVKGICQARISAVAWGEFTFVIADKKVTPPTFYGGFYVRINVEILFVFRWSGTLVEGEWHWPDYLPLMGGSNDEPEPSHRMSEGNKNLVRFVQKGDSVFALWVEGQGVSPRLLMQEVNVPDAQVIELFRGADTAPNYKYIYDLAAAADEQMIAYSLSMGNWDDFWMYTADYRNFDQNKDDPAINLINGMLENPDGFTCVGVYRNGKNALYKAENSWKKVLMNMKLYIFKYQTSGNQVLLLGTEFDNGCADVGFLQINPLNEPDGYSYWSTVRYDDAKVFPASEYSLPIYEAFPYYWINTGIERTGWYLSVLRTGRSGNQMLYAGEAFPYSKAYKVDIPSGETIMNMNEPVLFKRGEQQDGAVYITTVKQVPGSDGKTDNHLTQYALRHSNQDSRGKLCQNDLPTGCVLYNTLKFTDGSGTKRDYLWWNEEYSEGKGEDAQQKHRIRACMLDPEYNIYSPAFTVVDDLTQTYDGLYYSGKTQTLVFTEKGKHEQFHSVMTKVIPALEAFTPEYPTIAKGEPFRMYVRLRNDSHVILEKAVIGVSASPITKGADDKRKAQVFKEYTINLREPAMNSVTNYDYLMEDMQTLVGASREELDAALEGIAAQDGGSLNPYVETGAHTIVRITDFEENLNNAFFYKAVRDPETCEVVDTKLDKVYYFMPGNVATYLFQVPAQTEAQLEEWEGEYTLLATLYTLHFTLSPEEGAQRYVAVLNENANGQDTYDFYFEEDYEAYLAGDTNALTMLSPEKETILAQFDPIPGPSTTVYSGKDTSDLNMKRQNSLTAANRAYATMEHNDYQIETRSFFSGDEEYAEIRIRNEAVEAAPDATPKLIAQAQYVDGTWRNTGWELPLTSIRMYTGVGRGLTLPLAELANGQKYQRIRVGIVSTTSDDPQSFYDLNAWNNFSELNPKGDFCFVKNPQDLTVWEGEPASFECEVVGNSGPYTYQWVVCYPDNTVKAVKTGTTSGKRASIDWSLIRSALADNGSEHGIQKTTLADDQLTFWCVVSDNKGFSVKSDSALLTVYKNPDVPKTGDNTNLGLMLAIALASTAAIALLAKKRKSSEQQ